MSFNGKVALVTGASRGIGAAIADMLGEQGAIVVGTATTDSGAQKISERLAAKGIQGKGMTLDVTSNESVVTVLKAIDEEFGPALILVNNAGIMPVSLIASGMVDDWDRMIDINIKGVLYGVHAVLGTMLEQGSGSIINIASTAAHSVGPGGTVYSATKTAVRIISEGLRKEVSGKVRVCTICPGFTESELSQSVNDVGMKPFVEQLFDQMAMPAHAIAEAVAYALLQPANVAVNEITVRPLAAQDH